MLQAAAVTSDEQLVRVLADLGFEGAPLSPARRLSTLDLSVAERAQAPCCLIPWTQPGQGGERVLVSVESQRFCVYVYNVMEDVYSQCETLSGTMPEDALRAAILRTSLEAPQKIMPPLADVEKLQQFRDEIREKFGRRA